MSFGSFSPIGSSPIGFSGWDRFGPALNSSTPSLASATPGLGAQSAYAGPTNPGFSYREDAVGTAYFSYAGPYNLAAQETVINGATATLPSGRELTLAAGVPSFPEQIATVQGYIAEARATGDEVAIGKTIYHSNGNIQYLDVGPNRANEPNYPTRVESITAGLVDPKYEAVLFGR